MLHAASSEQQKIIEALAANNNVIVNAVPGSGKTTTALLVAQAFPDQKIILLTYNKNLQNTTQIQKDRAGLQNLTVKTVHASASWLFGFSCKDDLALDHCLESKEFTVPFWFDLVIIDEAQDLTPHLYEFLIKFLKHNSAPDQKVLIMGDPYQTIYDFNDADGRYLTLADKIFAVNNSNPWVRCSLSLSYRLSNAMASYLNDVFWQKNLIKTDRDLNNSLECWRINKFGLQNVENEKNTWYEHLKNLIDLYGVSNTFILVNSVKTKSQKNPLLILLKSLSEDGFPIGVREDIDEKEDWNKLDNKLICTTFHSVKGLERDLVIVFDYDEKIFYEDDHFNDRRELQKPLFVACTRAKKKLVLLQHYKNQPLTFLNQKLNENYFRDFLNPFEKANQISQNHWPKSPNYKIYQPSAITNFLSVTTQKFLLSFFDWKLIEKKRLSPLINPNTYLTFTSNLNKQEVLENVSMITGESLISNFEFSLTKHNKKLSILKNYLKLLEKAKATGTAKRSGEERALLMNYGSLLNSKSDLNFYEETNLDNEDNNRIATLFYAFQTGHWFKMRQISRFDWITQTDYQLVNEHLAKYLSSKTIFELGISYISQLPRDFDIAKRIINHSHDVGGNYYKIHGYIDAFDPERYLVWEFKFTKELTSEHFLQLYIYACLLFSRAGSDLQKQQTVMSYHFRLMNLKYSEIYELVIDWKKVPDFLLWLLYFKTKPKAWVSDASFIEDKMMLIANLTNSL